jgi:thiol:disulfide interchange protein DsbA
MSQSIDLSTRHFLKVAAAGAVALAAGCATRDPGQPPEEGFEYRAGGPWPTESRGKLEVTEFFWYACAFCNAFEPVLKDWMKRQPSDVVLRKVHPAVNKGWEPHSRLFYTLETMGKVEQLNDRVFFAMHSGGMSMDRRDEIANWAAGEGLDRARFLEVYDSREVSAKMDRATQMAKAFKLDGVPAIAVNGRWLTAPHMTGTRENSLRVVEYLLARERRGG